MRIAISAVVFLSVILISATLAAQELPAPAGPAPSPAPGRTLPPAGPAPSPAPGGTLPTAPAGPGAEATPPTTGPSPIPGTVPGAAPPAMVPPTTGVVSGDEVIPFTYDNMPLATIIELVAKRTGRNFLLQMPISGSITIHCPKGIRASQAFDILGIILDSLGFTMVVTDDPPLILVTQKRNTGPAVTDVKLNEEGASLDKKKRELATFIVVLKYVSVDDMQKVLANFKSSTCIMTAYQAGNFLILKDDEASLKYLMEIIDKIDVPGTGTKVTMVQLKYADASETATLLSELLAAREGARVTPATAVPRQAPPTPGGRPTAPQPTSIAPTIVGAAAPLKLIPEARTNRLVILASEKDTEYILKLVTEIDVEPLEDMYPVRTYIAQYQNADDLADTLASFVTGQPRQRTTGRTATGLTQQRARTGARTVGQPTAGPTGAAQRAAVAGGTEEGFFLADPATNIVLIQAPPQKLDMYMDLLRKLDQPQKQVLIEVWVVEISSNSQLDIGVEFQPAEPPPGAMTGPVQDALFGGTNFGSRRAIRLGQLS